MKYSIIIPTYNHVELLKTCIESIIAYTDLSDCEIIVVANGCTDGTEQYIKEMVKIEKSFFYLWYDDPMGYTKSVNEGIPAAIGEYIVLLNNDTVLLPQQKNKWLEMLVAPFLRDEKMAITGPMKEKTETIDRKFILFFCAMVKKSIFDELGLLDEIFSPGYGEDSVTGDTPVVIRRNGIVDIFPIADLYRKSEDGRDLIENVEVFTRSGWAKLNFSYRHTVKKPIYRVRTRSSQINITGDHCLFRNGKEVKVSELKVGDKIDLQTDLPLPKGFLTQKDAWEQGFFAAEGSVSIHDKMVIDSRSGNLCKQSLSSVSVCQYGDIGSERIDRVCKEWGWAKYECNAGETSTHEKYYLASLIGPNKRQKAKKLYNRYYTKNQEKRVPVEILNSDNETIQNFIDGYITGDGHICNRKWRRTELSFCTKSPTLAYGVQLLFKKLGRHTALNTRKDKRNIFNVRILNGKNPDTKKNPGLELKEDDGTIREIVEVTHLYCDENGYTQVYDINTDDGTFVTGPGGIIAHNTDYAFRAEDAGYKIQQVPDDNDYSFYGDKLRTGVFPIYHAGNQTFKDHPDPELIHRNNAIIKERYGKKAVMGTDNICPVTKQNCDDETCTVGAECNVSGNNITRPVDDIPPLLFKSTDVKQETYAYGWPIENVVRESFKYGEPIESKNLSKVDAWTSLDEKLAREKFIKDGWIKSFQHLEENDTVAVINIERAKTIDGFMGDKELEYLAKLASTAKVFIEIGSWHGKSSRAIADNLPEGGVLYCVDTWKGSENEQETHHASAKDRRGDGAFFWFLESCFDLIQKGKIIPLRMHSMNAINFLLGKLYADVIFIDANHTYECVKDDIRFWKSVVKKDGILCGHDYGTPNPELDGVTKAVNEMFPNVQIEPYTSIWVMDYSKKEEKPKGPNGENWNDWWEGEIKVTGKVTQEREPCVFDCFPFNNELDILEIRLNELYDVVDRFIIVEAKETHSGKPKELVFNANLKRFEKFLNKITYLVIEKFPDYLYKASGSDSDNNWARERYQRDYIMEGLKDCQPNDLVIISDCDEIPKASVVNAIKGAGIADEYALQMDLYYYNFNTKGVDRWDEAKIAKYKIVKQKSPCGIRYSKEGMVMGYGGWHFSYFGSVNDVINKIQSTAHQEYNTPYYTNARQIGTLISNGQDVFMRNNVKFTHSSYVKGEDLPKWVSEQNNPLWDKYANPNNS